MPLLRSIVVLGFVLAVACAVGLPLHWTLRDQERGIAENEVKLAEARAALAALPSQEALAAESARVTQDLALFDRLDVGRRRDLYAWLTVRAAASHAGVDVLGWYSHGDGFEITAIAEEGDRISELMRTMQRAGFHDVNIRCFRRDHCDSAFNDRVDSFERLGMGYEEIAGRLPRDEDVPSAIDPALLPLAGPMRLVPATIERAGAMSRATRATPATR